MKMTVWGTGAALAAWMVLAMPTLAQEVCQGAVRGDLGIRGLSCEGGCVASFNRLDGVAFWSFSTEPVIDGVLEDGPTAGILRRGDRVVSVDGMLITTSEGGYRLGMVEPGETVRLQYRRDGRVLTSDVRSGARCEPREDDAPAPADEVLAQDRDRRTRLLQLTEATRALDSVRQSAASAGEADSAALGRVADLLASVGAALAPPAPRNRSPGATLGVSLRCTDCSAEVSAEGTRWRFARPVEVYRVTAGGPADRAGVRERDLIRAIDGVAIESREGGERFSRLQSGESVRLTVSRPDGSFGSIVVNLEESVAEAAVAPDAPVAAGHADEEAIRFTGAIGEASVVVRGAPVNVVRYEAAGVLIIRSEDTEVRITVPPRR